MSVSRIGALRASFEQGERDPVTVGEAFLAAQPVGSTTDAFIEVDPARVRADTADASERLQRGAARGPLEGVLIGVKDALDVTGYATRAGTRFLRAAPTADALPTARLRAAGAVIAGKTRGTELGLSPVGINVAGGSPRNPHDPARPCGGSSSGSAAAVASGLVAGAVGSDGGGSLRIPPALCGVYGLKPTFGRIPTAGQLQLGWWSLDHGGAIAATVADLALLDGVLAGEQPHEPDPEQGRTLRFGLAPRWWAGGEPDAAVDERCRDAVSELPMVEVALDHLELVRAAEHATVLAETAAAMHSHLRDRPQEFGPDVLLMLRAAEQVTGADYVRAQQVRGLLERTFAAAFATVDVLVTPTTACTAPLLPAQVWADGLLDEELIGRLTAYSFPANLVGFPAITVPVGVDRDGLPIGLQLCAARGREAALLDAAAYLETVGVATCPPPLVETPSGMGPRPAVAAAPR